MLLAMDTASNTASVAIYDRAAARLLAETTWEGRRRQTQELMVTVRQLLALAEVTPDMLTALAVTTGPGSFTGVRIAISAANGIGLGLDTPPALIGVPTLSVTAAPWLTVAAACHPAPALYAVMQAGRGRYHWARFPADELLYRPDAAAHTTGAAADLVAALHARADAAAWLAGEIDDALAAATQTLPQVTLIPSAHAQRRAGVLAHLGAALLAAGQADTLAGLQPLYLREP
jgi:tRNA threonylcarbamoyl adenosine modification protein YeaZ